MLGYTGTRLPTFFGQRNIIELAIGGLLHNRIVVMGKPQGSFAQAVLHTLTLLVLMDGYAGYKFLLQCQNNVWYSGKFKALYI